MRVEGFKCLVGWKYALDAARATMNLPPIDKEPSEKFRRDMCRAEHSPLREVRFRWWWRDLPSWVSVHFVRHNIGISHFVGTQRTDRTGIDRAKKPQDAPVTHYCSCNAAEMIYISRKRLCGKASPETRQAWKMVLDELAKVDPILAEYCVPECEYRGGICPEIESCGRVGRGGK